MRTLLFILCAFTIVQTAAAQCEKRFILHSNRTEYVNIDGELERTVDEESVVEWDNKEILISPGNEPTMRGTVNSITCEWTTPMKEGKTVIKATITTGNGESMNLTITIEGKDGKQTFLAEIDQRPERKIRLVVTKFEEKK
jgi:hypothetical protein